MEYVFLLLAMVIPVPILLFGSMDTAFEGLFAILYPIGTVLVYAVLDIHLYKKKHPKRKKVMKNSVKVFAILLALAFIYRFAIIFGSTVQA